VTACPVFGVSRHANGKSRFTFSFISITAVEKSAMANWEYSRLSLNDLPRETSELDLLNDAGEEGWELVFITSNHIAILKRSVNGQAAPAAPRRKRAGSTTRA
jgi:hypothetical protein